jgi:hypothetical protein
MALIINTHTDVNEVCTYIEFGENQNKHVLFIHGLEASLSLGDISTLLYQNIFIQ